MDKYQKVTLKCQSFNLKGKFGSTRKYTNKILQFSTERAELVEFIDLIQFNEQRPKSEKGEAITPKHLLRDSRYRRVRKNLITLIEHNKNTFPHITNKFITLTYKENYQNVKQSNIIFKEFIRKVNKYVCPNFQYIAVLEFQKRGAIHYHLFSPNLPRLSRQELQHFTNYVWGNGRTQIKEVNQHDEYLGLYMGKYITKKSYDSRLDGEKAYFTSRGIIRPETIHDPHHIATKVDTLPQQCAIVTEYKNRFKKPVRKTTWNLKDFSQTKINSQQKTIQQSTLTHS